MIDKKYLGKSLNSNNGFIPMRISAIGILANVKNTHKPMAEELSRNLELMAKEFYKGNISIVDDFLQLFALDEHRPKSKEGE